MLWRAARCCAAGRPLGKLFGDEPDARLDRPFLWIQSDVTQTPEYTDTRDRLLASQQGRGTLLTIRGSMHLGFTDDPSYLTSPGRALLGEAGGMGSLSLAEMTAMTGDAVASFVAPALGVRGATRFGEAVGAHPAIRLEAGTGRARALAAASALDGQSQASDHTGGRRG